ncbi:MAG: hypothetical protein C0624_08200 [Desulfuromonas sp.]|nr:MAG: hypothetical protein C0624_08200 [Desulfuromonas sp.]
MKRLCWILLALLAMLLAPATGFAEDDTSDRPDWAGKDSTGQKPGNKNQTPGEIMGEDYGDLWVVLRDGNGIPIVDNNGCLQPVTTDGDILSMVLVEGSCELLEDDLLLVQEVEFGRMSVVRSPDFVLETSFLEALNALNGADTIELDPAGRLFLSTGDVSKAIDSPLENIALYQKLMQNGFIPGLTKDLASLGALSYIQSTKGPGEHAAEALDHNDLNLAAALYAAGADKTGTISLDMVVIVNTWLGLNEDDHGNQNYFDFTGYTHNTHNRYAGIEPMLLSGPVEMPDDDYDWFFIAPIMIYNEVTFNDPPAWYLFGGATEFTKAADDALHVIEFIHNWAVPVY